MTDGYGAASPNEIEAAFKGMKAFYEAKPEGHREDVLALISALNANRAEIAFLREQVTRLTQAQAIYDRNCSWRHISDRDTRIRELEEHVAQLTRVNKKPGAG